MKRTIWAGCVVALMIGAAVALSACARDAEVASHNLSYEADNFKINRRVVFYNGINGEWLLEIRGYCSLSNASTGNNTVAVTCKIAEGQYKKHFLSKSDNVTWFAEQLEPGKFGTQQYKVSFKPSVILPDVELR